jgi:hypothetical protein
MSSEDVADLNDVADYEMAMVDREDNDFNEVHSRLHGDLKFVLNSINLLIGRPSSGKSRFVFHEITKLKYIPNPYSQFIYVSDEENDKTYLKYKDLIKIPTLKVKYNDAYETITDIITTKNVYEDVREKKLPATEKDKKELLDLLDVKYFKKPAVHTLVLFGDATDLFTNKNNPLNQIILRNRHNKITYFFNVHSFSRSAIPMYIKKNITSLVYFGMYSALDFNSAYTQMKSPIDRKKLYEICRKLGYRDALLFNFDEGEVKCEVLEMGGQVAPY